MLGSLGSWDFSQQASSKCWQAVPWSCSNFAAQDPNNSIYMEGWQAGWPLHIFVEKCAFFDMPWNYQSHNVLQGDVGIKPVCSLHLCLHSNSERAQITWQIQKACQEKENIPTATSKKERIAQGTCLDSLILLPLKEAVILLVTSVLAEHNPAHWLAALLLSGEYLQSTWAFPGPSCLLGWFMTTSPAIL